MARRFTPIVAAVLLLLFVAVFVVGLGLMATAEVTQTGTASGVNFSLSNGAFRNTSFTPSPSGFRFVSTPWIGAGELDVTCSGGQLFINGRSAGAVQAGDQLTVTLDQQVLVNGGVRR